jgi:transcriptional regulator NrdR family protein
MIGLIRASGAGELDTSVVGEVQILATQELDHCVLVRLASVWRNKYDNKSSERKLLSTF